MQVIVSCNAVLNESYIQELRIIRNSVSVNFIDFLIGIILRELEQKIFVDNYVGDHKSAKMYLHTSKHSYMYNFLHLSLIKTIFAWACRHVAILYVSASLYY